MLAKVLEWRAHPEDPRGPLGACGSPAEAGAGKSRQTSAPRDFLEPQRPDGDLVLPTPTTAASSQCLPLQHRFYLVVLGILQGQEVGSLGLQASLQGPS